MKSTFQIVAAVNRDWPTARFGECETGRTTRLPEEIETFLLVAPQNMNTLLLYLALAYKNARA